MDVEKVKSQQELYPEVDSVISKTLDNTEDGYRYLYNLKGSIPKELYLLIISFRGHMLRMMNYGICIPLQRE